MNLLSIVKNELNAAWNEVNRPMFSENQIVDDTFYSELFNYFHRLEGKTIDTGNGESLFPFADQQINRRLTVNNPPRFSLADIKVNPNLQRRRWRPA